MDETFKPAPWPQPGSTLYYSLLHCEKAALTRTHRTLELVRTLCQVLDNVSEPAVAEQKVHWWHEELARLGGPVSLEGPRHPSCQRFLGGLELDDYPAKLPGWWMSRLLAILSANSNERFAPALDFDAFETRIYDDYRARLELLGAAISGVAPLTSRVSSDSPAEEFQLPQNLVTGLGICHRLRTFRDLYSGGNPVWPDKLYEQFELPSESLHDEKYRDSLLSLFGELRQRAYNILEQGLSEAWQMREMHSAANPAANQAILTAAELRHAQLRLWKRKPPDLLRQYRGLTPFKKSLLLWRCQRRLARMQRQ